MNSTDAFAVTQDDATMPFALNACKLLLRALEAMHSLNFTIAFAFESKIIGGNNLLGAF